MLCYITKTRTNGGRTQNENEIKIKIAVMRTNENENDSGQKTHLVIKNFCSQQQLHGPITIACCGHRSLRQLLAFSRCRWSAKLNKQLYDRWTRSVDHLKTVVVRARRVICVDVWSKPYLSTSYLEISVCFFDFDPCSHTSRHIVLNITNSVLE